ncbi:hypothetical protein LY76DRAFT_606720 [Colletotrichum caudatum]|nr:hypothetical protein LY76DRAFT_606720 [Colletotrichum caudatum]
MLASRAPPLPTPTTIDTPNKILARWQPVYPQSTEGLKGWCQENVAPDGKSLDIATKKPATAVAPSVPYEDASPTQLSAYRVSPEPKESQGTMKKPLRVSIHQPERKAREKALLQQGTKAGLQHPPIYQYGRMFRSLQGPPKIPEADYKKRSAMTSQGTVSSNADLPSTWKLTLSTSSSLELAMEAVSQEMERESKLPESERVLKQILVEQPQPSAAREDKDDERIPPPSRKESIPPPKEQPTRKTFRDGNGPVSKGQDDCDIDDRDVLRGLNIAISAACDEEVDAWIRLKTGVRIRRFLADLKAFETLGDDHEPDQVKEHARKRRADSRKLKAQIQQSKAATEVRAQ